MKIKFEPVERLDKSVWIGPIIVSDTPDFER